MGHSVFGVKAAAGLCQAIIAMMPLHHTYVETHLGTGVIMERKPSATHSTQIFS